MEKTSVPKIWLYIIVGVIAVVVILFADGGAQAPTTEPGEATIDASRGEASNIHNPPQVNSSASSQSNPPATKPSPSHVFIVTPGKDDVLRAGNAYEIAWNRTPEIPGALELLNAEDGTSIGWIHPNIGGKQIAFTWMTRDVAISRSGPARKNIGAGAYKIRFVFDGARPDVVSETFTLGDAGTEDITRIIRIAGNTFNPRSLSVLRGVRVSIVNSEAIAHTITSSTDDFPTLVLAAGESRMIDTLNLSAATYPLISSVFSYRTSGNLVVRDF